MGLKKANLINFPEKRPQILKKKSSNGRKKYLTLVDEFKRDFDILWKIKNNE